MWLRRAFLAWLIPGAFVLPLWLLIGWVVFNASGWVLLWVLLVAIPSVFLGQLALALLVRARGTVRHSRAVSWWDVLGFTVWNGLTIAVGFYPQGAFWPLLLVAVLTFFVLFWLQLWQLFEEMKPSSALRRAANGGAYLPPPAPSAEPTARADGGVIIVTESGTDDTR